MSSAELHSEFLPACGSNFCSKVTPKRPSRSNTLFPHQPRSVRLQGAFRSQIPPSSQPEKNVVRKPPSCTMHRALRSVPASSESNAAQNNEELRRSAAAVAAQGGVYPPLEPIRAVAAGGGRPPPRLVTCCCWGGLPPRGLLGPAAAAFWVETLMKRFYKGASRTCLRP